MASDAFTRLEETMSAAREAELAAYIMRDVELRQANAKGKQQGLLAVLRKAASLFPFCGCRKRCSCLWQKASAPWPAKRKVPPEHT